MKIRCLKVFHPAPKESKGVSGQYDDISVGKEYTVISIQTNPSGSNGDTTIFRIIPDIGSPSLYPSVLFEIINNQIPKGWGAVVKHTLSIRYLEIGPIEWLRDDFWEDFFNDDPKAFEDFKRVMEKTQ